jgi:mannose-6-phosphate isomerase-like protein (cupin superfamily)
MNVIDIRGFSEDAVVGPDNGATRLFIWCTTAPAGQVVALHHHLGEELIRVLYGKLRFRVGDQIRDVGAGEVVIVAPGAVHGYVTLEDAEIEVYGEIGAGIFVTTQGPDGTTSEQEIFVRDVPWSRAPTDDSKYISRSEQLERFRERYKEQPFA